MTSNPSASVVIPTYNRLPALRQVVDAVEQQAVGWSGSIEIVVVDDGSSDGSLSWLQGRSGAVQLTVLHQANSGPARARNRGAAAAAGDVVLFLGDDTVPQAGWLGEHLELHRLCAGDDVAVVGYTSFPPDQDTPFLRFINENGAQFGYLLIADAGNVPFNFFYTSNVSLPRRILVRLGGFREDFPAAAWEDIEFAYRATLQGMKLVYQPRARTEHRHRLRPSSFCLRQRKSGRSAAIFAALHPELEGFLRVSDARRPGIGARLAQLVRRLATGLGEVVPGGLSGATYERMLDVAYLHGLADGLEDERLVQRQEVCRGVDSARGVR
jgi:GT2 family glycosyltransferase